MSRLGSGQMDPIELKPSHSSNGGIGPSCDPLEFLGLGIPGYFQLRVPKKHIGPKT